MIEFPESWVCRERESNCLERCVLRRRKGSLGPAERPEIAAQVP
jgi:hypothetical protein